MIDRVSTEKLANGALRYEMFDSGGVSQGYVYLLLADDPSETGTALNAANLLSSATATKLGKTASATVNDAISQSVNVTEVTLPVANWTLNGGNYSQTVSVAGVTAAMTGIQIVPVKDSNTNLTNYNKAYGNLNAGYATPGSGTVTFVTPKVPAVTIKIGLRGV